MFVSKLLGSGPLLLLMQMVTWGHHIIWPDRCEGFCPLALFWAVAGDGGCILCRLQLKQGEAFSQGSPCLLGVYRLVWHWYMSAQGCYRSVVCSVAYAGDIRADKLEEKWFIEQRPVLKVSVADDSRTAETEITHQPYIFREGGTRYLILCPPQTLWEENHDLISDHQWKVFPCARWLSR